MSREAELEVCADAPIAPASSTRSGVYKRVPLQARATARPEVDSVPNGADAVASLLYQLGVRRAFGLMGGAIALFCDALRKEGIEVVHARHESGAALMAAEAHFVTNEPVVVFTTTGPGATNAITGLVSAACDGAQIIMVSGATDLGRRGREAFQETGPRSLALDAWITPPCKSLEFTVENVDQITLLGQQLASGLASKTGFIANLTLPNSLQAGPAKKVRARLAVSSPPSHSIEQVADVVSLLRGKSLALWVGFGARKAAPTVREFAERTRARVMASPRAKGIFPEDHPLYLGVTGMFGGHAAVPRELRRVRPDHILVLGSRLGEHTSCFDADLTPRQSFIHVDLDPAVFGRAYPSVDTVGICAEIGEFLAMLTNFWPEVRPSELLSTQSLVNIAPSEHGVHPRDLMAAVQRVVVETTDAQVMSDAGNAFAWANAELRFNHAGRYRTTSGFGTMTKASAGVVGAAWASGRPAVALVGDGAMLMGNEVSTAVQHGIPAKWVVLNDAGYGMIRHGMVAIGLDPFATSIPRTDFSAWARALGAEGLEVSHAKDLQDALKRMMRIEGPVVLDVRIDPRAAPPFGKRNQSLSKDWG